MNSLLLKDVCCICEDKVCEENKIVLHKTRRQIHQLCNDCGVGYMKSIFVKLTNSIRHGFHKKKSSYFTCCGTISGLERNRCSHSISIISLNIHPSLSIYEDFIRLKYILENDNVYICPNKQCGNIFEIVINEDKLLCNSCNETWCKKCNATPYHSDLSCLENELKLDSKDENIQFIKQEMDKKMLKICPGCKSAIYRIEGCNKITCTYCDEKWCWLCNKKGIDYDHFTRGKCEGKLYEKS